MSTSLSSSTLNLDQPSSRRSSPNMNRKPEWVNNVHQYKLPPTLARKQSFIPGKWKAKMSITKSEEFNTPAYLSWRKLQLSRHKLKNSGKTSALLSGFAMVSIVDVQVTGAHLPGEFLVALAVCTTLLVAVHMLALMISTCISPNIDAIHSLDSINLVDESPHERLHWYIELAWAFSTLLGLLLFMIEVAMLCYVKFHQINETAAWVACVILVPVLLIFLIFAIHFYRTLVTHKYEVTCSGIKELELIKEKIEQQNSLEGHPGIGELYTVRVV